MEAGLLSEHSAPLRIAAPRIPEQQAISGMDEPSSSLVDALLAGYGEGYRNPLMDGDSVDFSTANVLAGMNARQAAKDREPYEALTRLFTTAMAPMAGAHAAIPGNLPKAISRHMRLERWADNPWTTNPVTSPILEAYLALASPLARRGLQGDFSNPLSTSLIDSSHHIKHHARSTAQILQYLDRTSPKTKTLY